MAWTHLQIPNGKANLFCNAYVTDISAVNIIVTHTPIISTLEIQEAYQPLTKYGVNIFAFDFSGTGQSGGYEKNFSLSSVVNDLDAVTNYIEKHYSSAIHLYGNTGVGGMLAQYYICTTKKIKSFAQFGFVEYQNTAGIGYPYWVARVISQLLRFLPNFHITVKPPKYNGFNSEIDNGFYEKLLETNPDIFKNSTKVLSTVLACFVARDSAIKNGISIPTLVFKTLHDRYFSTAYIDSYYKSLHCEKKLVEIDDIHNSYYFRSEEFCNEVYQWFLEHN